MPSIPCTKVTRPSGNVVLMTPDGSATLSCNPSSTGTPGNHGPYYFSLAPAGAEGAYEVCVVNGGQAAYNPLPDEVAVFVFTPSTPGGTAAVSKESL